jgi:CRP-like cAMP-binding protein
MRLNFLEGTDHVLFSEQKYSLSLPVGPVPHTSHPVPVSSKAGMPMSTNNCDQCRTSDCPFRRLDAEERRQIRDWQHSWRARPGQNIYVASAPADGVYILCDGSVKLLAAGKGGKCRIAALVRPGEWFGLDALLPDGRRSFTAEARESSAVCCIERDHFREVMQGNTTLLWQLTTTLNRLLHDAQESNILFSGKPLNVRLLNALGQCKANSIALKQVEIAHLLGVSSEAINRELRRPRRTT